MLANSFEQDQKMAVKNRSGRYMSQEHKLTSTVHYKAGHFSGEGILQSQCEDLRCDVCVLKHIYRCLDLRDVY
jgi:hypothetical protein